LLCVVAFVVLCFGVWFFLILFCFDGPRTDASPEELAEYVRAIASTRPNISVEYISNLLSQDGLVNVHGEELTSYISRALDRILGTNNDKVSAASSSVHTSTHPATSSSNSRRTTNSTTTSINNSRTTSYPKKRDREEPQRRQQSYHDRTAAGGTGSSGAGTSPKMWHQSARDSYSSSSRYGMNQSTNSTSSTMNRQSNTSVNSSIAGGGGNTHTARSRNAPPNNNNTRSTATASFNGGGFHPKYHDYSTNTTPATSSSYKQHQSHTNISHPHKRNDQYVNSAVPPPPPPPPPLPIEEQRTLKLTHVPKSITMVQLSHYFEQHNVTIVSMKLLASSSDPQEHQKQQQQQLDPLYHTYVVQCGSHDQAKTILQSFPVLGYPCVQITLHPTNLEEGRPEVPRPHPSYNPHHQHYVESKIIPTAAVTVTPINFESEHQQQQHLLQQERISSISKTLELKHQQEILLQKQLEMQQKILQKVSDSTERKSKVLKEILQLQKRLVALRQEILENQNTLATASTTTIHPQQQQHHSSPAKRFRLDRRTKTLKVTGYPLELTTLVSFPLFLHANSHFFLY
jgi:hypothetical protein